MDNMQWEQALTIQKQIGQKALVMIGARNQQIGLTNGNPFFAFRIIVNPSKIREIKVMLMPSDTYNVIFYNIHMKVIKSFTEIYAEYLTKIIHEVTGIALSL